MPRLAVLLFFVASPALAQTRPLLTEEAGTAPSGTVALEAGVDWIAAEPNFLTGAGRDRYELPVLRLVYSPSDNVEMDVDWAARTGVHDDPDFGSVSDWGDVTLRAKVRFLEGGPGRPALGARFGVTLPVTSFGNGLSSNTLRMRAELLLTQQVASARLHLNAGVAIQDEALRPHEQRDLLAFGAALESPIGKRVTVLLEVAGQAGEGTPGADQRIEARAGVRFQTEGRLAWDAALRRGLAEADGAWGFTVGLAYRLKTAHFRVRCSPVP